MKITTRVSPEENYYVGQSSGPFLNFPVERAVNPIYNSSQILISLKLTGGHFRRVKPMHSRGSFFKASAEWPEK